jgi:hypothetical protein
VLWDADAGSRGSEHLDASVGMWRAPAWALGPSSAAAARVGADHGRACGHRGERERGGLRGHSAAALSRDAEQHTYKTRGSSSLVVQESKSDIK